MTQAEQIRHDAITRALQETIDEISEQMGVRVIEIETDKTGKIKSLWYEETKK